MSSTRKQHPSPPSHLAALAGVAAAFFVATATLALPAGPANLEQDAVALPPGLKGPTNAALRHYRAWGSTTSEVLQSFGKLWDAEKELTPGWKPSAEMKAVIVQLNDYTNLALRATRLETADWGIEYADGWMAMLPHLGKLREEARVLEMTARTILSGNPGTEERAHAVAILAGLFRLPAHSRNDSTLISTLVAEAIAVRACDVVTALIDQRVLTQADTAEIATAARALNSSTDPFNFATCMRFERLMAARLFDKKGPDAGAQAEATARELRGMNGPGDPASTDVILARISLFDEKALREDVVRQGEYYAQAEKIMASRAPDGAEQLSALEARAVEGEFGLTLQLIVPAFSKAYASDAKNRAKLAEFVKRIDALK